MAWTKVKSKGRQTDRQEEAAAMAASSLHMPGTSVKKATNVIVAENVFMDTSAGEDSAGSQNNVLIMALLDDILSKTSGQPQPLYNLDQEICAKLRKVTKQPIPSFKDFAKIKLRLFIERNSSHFSLTLERNSWMVSKKKKSKRKKKKCDNPGAEKPDEVKSGTLQYEESESNFESSGDLAEEEQWKEVKPQRRRNRQTESAQTSALSISAELSIECSGDERMLKDFLSTNQGCNTLIFRCTDKDYLRDTLMFTVDVVSLWNTPRRNEAYIILGVKTKDASLPHIPVGLTEAREDSFYKSLFRKELFALPPKFSYREVMYQGKRIGIVQVENSRGHQFPGVVRNNDMYPTLQKDQLWARKEGKNELVSTSDYLMYEIQAWFLCSTMPKESMKPAEEARIHSVEQSPSWSSEVGNTGKEAKELIKELGSFQTGHFVLLCGSMRNSCRNIDALASAPWIAVYDFDIRGRDPSGLLAILEDDIKQKRSLRVCTWRDQHTGITERGTQWWSLRGRRDVPDSLTSETSPLDWFRCVLSKLDGLCIEMARFCEDYTIVTMVVLWPCSDFEARCLQKFLTKMQERFQPQIILCFMEPESAFSKSLDVQHLQRDFAGNVKTFHISLADFCMEIKLLMQSSLPPAVFEYKLPSEESRTVTITDKDFAWLDQDLDVLYLQSPHIKRALTAEDLRQEAENFFRGGTIQWYVRYDMGSGYLDIERSISKDVTRHIQEVYIDAYKNGQVTLFHAPGSGGSTLSQRILWDLHENVPCVQVRQRSGSSVEDIADKLGFLQDRTHMPVVLLMDGEDESRLKQLSRQLQRKCMIILYVKRYPHHIDELRRNVGHESKFFLSGIVDKKESRNLVVRFTDRCMGDKRKEDALMMLDNDVQKEDEKHHMYEYGMTVYLHEFKGVQSYVRGYLDPPRNWKDLQPWQRCLGFLSLVYYYGQSSLPCQIFTSVLGMPANRRLNLDDFPFQFKVFVVSDTIEGRAGYIRIAHYIFAKEILEQILGRNQDSTSRKVCDRLSKDARQNLKGFSIDFISQIAKRKTKTALTAQTITYILAKTFIFRDNKEVNDMETQSKKPQFSQIMFDLDSDLPYCGRLEVLQKLCDTFPDDPNFRAHLGRFYTCCRPEEEEAAEKHFTAAIRLCKRGESSRETEDIDEKSMLTLMHVYHMFGMFYQVRITRHVGSVQGEGHVQRLRGARFTEMCEQIFLDADQACGKFLLSRNHTPAGHEDTQIYINEIQVRLQVCDFVNRRHSGGIKEFLTERNRGLNYQFVRNSITEIQDLIMECYNVIPANDITYLQRKVQWFNDLFRECSAEIRTLEDDNELTSLRRCITAKKLEFRGGNNIVSVESQVPSEQIEGLVKLIEKVFKYQAANRDTPKRKLELDYKDWILAIRNPSFRKIYSIVKVLRYVRDWNESVRSPLSTFYLFVLLSLQGFGTSRRPGNTECLLEAQQLLEDELQKKSKTVIKSRFAREWLGSEDLEGIRRLVSNRSVGHTHERGVKSAAPPLKLAVCKGTIRPKNKKLSGFIDLDLEGEATSVKVFYVPVLSDLQGSRYEGTRVQFQLAFTLEKGYEAFGVNLLERYSCHKCHRKVEMTLDQRETECPCGSVIIQSERNQVPRAATRQDE